MNYNQVREICEIPRGWEKFFRSNWQLIADILLTLHNSPYQFAPKNADTFRMLYAISPEKVRVIIVGQSPYADGNACGIPFVTKNGTISKTLQNIAKELARQYPHSKKTNINETITNWIDEGIFSINMSFSIGIPTPKMKKCDEYILNHDILWEEFVRRLVEYVTKKRKIPIILFGAVAWGLEDEVMSTCDIIKAPFPTRDEFIGSGVFGKCDKFVDDINWI